MRRDTDAGRRAFAVGKRTYRRLSAELLQRFRQVAPTEEALDLVAEVWTAAVRLFRHDSSLRHYLHTICGTKMFEWSRRLPHRRAFAEPLEAEAQVDDEPALDEAVARRHRIEEIFAAMERVTPDFRVVLEMKLQGYRNRDISKILDLDYHTVRSRGSRGRRELLEELEREAKRVAARAGLRRE